MLYRHCLRLTSPAADLPFTLASLMATINSLSRELLAMVVENLEPSDLYAFRLASRSCYTVAIAALWKSRHVRGLVLHWAAENGVLQTVQTVIRAGAEINYLRHSSNMEVHERPYELVQDLRIASNGPPKWFDGRFHSPLDCFLNKCDSCDWDGSHWNDTSLGSEWQDPKAAYWTPLYAAISNGHKRAAERLLREGASINVPACEFRRAVQCIAKHHDVDVEIFINDAAITTTPLNKDAKWVVAAEFSQSSYWRLGLWRVGTRETAIFPAIQIIPSAPDHNDTLYNMLRSAITRHLYPTNPLGNSPLPGTRTEKSAAYDPLHPVRKMESTQTCLTALYLYLGGESSLLTSISWDAIMSAS